MGYGNTEVLNEFRQMTNSALMLSICFKAHCLAFLPLFPKCIGILSINLENKNCKSAMIFSYLISHPFPTYKSIKDLKMKKIKLLITHPVKISTPYSVKLGAPLAWPQEDANPGPKKCQHQAIHRL